MPILRSLATPGFACAVLLLLSQRPADGFAQMARQFTDCAACPAMVVVPAGTFVMGSPETEPGRDKDESPQRRITFDRAFAVSRTEVTRGQYAAFAKATGRTASTGCWSDRDGDGKMAADPASTWMDTGFDQSDEHPVVCVNWDDARAYVEWLNTQTGGKTYRLLSEAEWEYAARAGTTTAFSWGDAASRDHVNYGAEQCCSPATGGRDRWRFTAPVASFPANAFGLHDMHGNASEWVEDCYAKTLDATPANGAAYQTPSCDTRVVRNAGGSFGGTPAWARSASRSGDPKTLLNTNVGFRVAKTL